MQANVHQPTAPRYSTLEVDQEARLTPGSVVLGGRLTIAAELARGGTSIVYHAIDHTDGDRHVALKIINADADPVLAEARFRNEVHLMKSLAGHPHVVPALATGRLDGPPRFEGRCYLLTQLIQGVALDRVMGDHRLGLEWRRACTIARDVARALVALHDRGVVHRDIKPGNVLLAQGGAERALVVDFGVAHATGDGWETRTHDLTRQGILGTLLYMPPEQVAHERPSPSMDIYSFGITLYELLSGNPPYHKLTVDEIVARKCDGKRQPFPLAKLCPELDSRITRLVARCLQHEPEARPRATELVDTLDAVLGTRALAMASPAQRMAPTIEPAVVELRSPVAGTLSTPLGSGPRRRHRAKGIIAAAALTLVGVVLGMLAPELVTTDASEREQAAAPLDVPRQVPTTTEAAVASAPTPPPAPPTPAADEPAREHDSNQTVARAPAAPPTPSTVKSKRRPEKCADTVEAAKQAAESRDWARVLELTKRDACWKPNAVEVRVRLRTQALFETLRYEECAKTGRGSNAPDVVRWAHICAGKSQGGAE